MFFMVYKIYKKGDGIMKYKLLTALKNVIKAVAIFSVATPSQIGVYQRKYPKSLEKYHY